MGCPRETGPTPMRKITNIIWDKTPTCIKPRPFGSLTYRYAVVATRTSLVPWPNMRRAVNRAALPEPRFFVMKNPLNDTTDTECGKLLHTFQAEQHTGDALNKHEELPMPRTDPNGRDVWPDMLAGPHAYALFSIGLGEHD